ncbi:hypothetical protein VTK73DRAFT_6030 [Phialemonium thermophilum]|uniref:Uncharacterized protein n=1 Tax=Phialemonium thermophilum TaxID=223376 RepID=A0ABR3XW33_9PEZI
MKFAKELEQNLVPEWRVKYLNYKAGKKYVKSVARAVNRARSTPSLGRRSDHLPRASSFVTTLLPDGETRDFQEHYDAGSTRSASGAAGRLGSSASRPRGETPHGQPPAHGEETGLARSPHRRMQYGSFGSATSPATSAGALTHRNTFELPAPAIHVPHSDDLPTDSSPQPLRGIRGSLRRLPYRRTKSMAITPSRQPDSPAAPQGTPKDAMQTPRQRLARIFTGGSPMSRQVSRDENGQLAMDEVYQREREFFSFLDRELEKVETFYRQKEEQAGKRLEVLRQQLHEMRNRRIAEIAENKKRKEHTPGEDRVSSNGYSGTAEDGKDISRRWVDPLKDKIFKPGPNSQALQAMPRTPVMTGLSPAARRDYMRRPADTEVSYRTAKRKLKLAMQEFYRGLELLKSYALLNRTAFRKLNKKYDKAVNARPPYRYMNEKVNKAWFVNSDVLDGYITTVEDLYARYFEGGNHKIAAGKLRSLIKQPTDQSATTFRSGILLGLGLVLAVQGLTYGVRILFHNPAIRERSSYLLQIYGGYALMLYIFGLFCLDCRVWTLNKINYPFIFEFDTRNHLDWRELSEFFSLFFFLFGFFIWLNFSRYGADSMYLYYPVVLIFVTLVVLFFPAPILRHKSRIWFLYSHFRLFFAGLYPVEFRDFFLGDIYCSLTYSLCNVELFFCLYAHYWNDPQQCNSNHSRLLGFFAALPPIWRAFQCLRRYYDTRNVFPHLVNCGKYSMSIMAAVWLSLFRINPTDANLAGFITFSTVNAVYCSVWDVFMDFSLFQAHSRHPFLRDILALRRRWLYYVIMVIDPILRFSWIFYAIFSHNTQHSTIVSFMVSFAEVTRRGMWTLFRVENEHCANVAQYRASRDVPLPYQLEPIVERPSLEAAAPPSGTIPPPSVSQPGTPAAQEQRPEIGRSTGVSVPGELPSTTAPALEEGAGIGRPEEGPPEGGTVRRRRAMTAGRSIARIMAEAHKQDFEKKRRPAEDARTEDAEDADEDGEEDEDLDDMRSQQEEDEEDEETGSMLEERLAAQEAETLMRSKASDSDE